MQYSGASSKYKSRWISWEGARQRGAPTGQPALLGCGVRLEAYSLEHAANRRSASPDKALLCQNCAWGCCRAKRDAKLTITLASGNGLSQGRVGRVT